MSVYLRISKEEARNLVGYGEVIGLNQTLVDLGLISMSISRNQAHKMVGYKRLKSWENAGLIRGITTGSGKTSKIEYNRMDILRLYYSEVIVVDKEYNI